MAPTTIVPMIVVMGKLVNIVSRMVVSERALVSRRALGVVATLTVAVVLAAGTAVSVVDSEHFPTVWEGFWWASSTVTTVGYGDFVPQTLPGRLIAVVLMFTGIGLVSILTAAIASALLAEEVGDEELHLDGELVTIMGILTSIDQRLAALEKQPSVGWARSEEAQ